MARPTPEKLALLRKKLAEKGIERARKEGGIPRRSGDGDAPLSNGQSRLWFMDQIEPGSSAYNDGLTLTIRLEPGVELDPELFRRAFQEVVRRHEIMRTTFHTGATGPVQRVTPIDAARLGHELPFEVVDGRALPEGEVDAKLLADVQAPYRLDRLPLHRAILARVADDEWKFGLAMHHIISDGVSYGVIYEEIGTLYRAYRAGRPSPLEELPIQFADFAQQEHDALDEAQVEEKIAYWRRYLGGELPALDWPARKAEPKHAGAYHRFRFSEALYAALQDFCKDHQVTSNWVLMAAYFALLNSLSGQTDVRIGTPSSTRKQGELEKLIGFFVQTVILRVDLSGNPTFLEVLRRTKATALEVSKYEDVPFERIVRGVRPRGDDGLVPLIQAWIAPMKDLMPVMRLDGATTSYQIVDGKIARFDFAIILDEARGGVEAFVEYDTDLFHPDVVRQLAERYMEILRRAVDHPETTLKLFRETVAPIERPDAPDGVPSAPRPARRTGPKTMKRVQRRSLGADERGAARD